jgi:hypothetical protein
MHYEEIVCLSECFIFKLLLDRCEIQSYHSSVDKGSSLERVAWTSWAAGT